MSCLWSQLRVSWEQYSERLTHASPLHPNKQQLRRMTFFRPWAPSVKAMLRRLHGNGGCRHRSPSCAASCAAQPSSLSLSLSLSLCVSLRLCRLRYAGLCCLLVSLLLQRFTALAGKDLSLSVCLHSFQAQSCTLKHGFHFERLDEKQTSRATVTVD